MGTVTGYKVCSICGGTVITNYHSHSSDYSYTCTDCGRHFATHILYGKEYAELDWRQERGAVAGPDGKWVIRVENSAPTGSYCFSPLDKSKATQLGALDEAVTRENWKELFDFEAIELKIDPETSYIALYNDGEYDILWGNKANTIDYFIDPEFVDDVEKHDWDVQVDPELPFGVFLTDNATDEMCEHLELERLPNE